MSLEFARREQPLTLTRTALGAAELEEFVDTLRWGWPAAGPRTTRFEAEVEIFTGLPHAIAVPSAPAGVLLALLAMGVSPEDEILTSPLAPDGTVDMIEAAGARPVFVDVEPHTLQLDTGALEGAVTTRTVGIVAAHHWGAPCDLDGVSGVAERHGLWVLEDGARGLGMRYRGRHVGSSGALGVFSLPLEGGTTGNGGGVVVTRDIFLAERIRALRGHVHIPVMVDGGELVLPPLESGFTDLQAVLALHELAGADTQSAARRRCAALYDQLLGDVAGIEVLAAPPYPHVSTHTLYAVAVTASSGLTRDELVAELAARNVSSGSAVRPVHLEPYYAATHPTWPGRLRVAEDAADRLCSLPIFAVMEDDDVRYVVAALKDTLVSARRPELLRASR